jgi:type-F conjugative transfer system pilin assembly protein TrbC
MKILKSIFLASVVAAACASVAQAQSDGMPTDAEIKAQQKQINNSFQATDVKPLNGPTKRTIESTNQGKSFGATLDAANQIKGDFGSVSKASRAQFENLARGKMQAKPQVERKGESDLMIFVSFSMPDEMIASYVQQAKRFGGVLMIRGFVADKMSMTKAAIERLNQSGVEWQINPEPFKKFKVEKVPAIVLASVEDAQSVMEDGCATPGTYSMVTGDLAILDALDKISLRSQTKISKFAKNRLLADRASGGQGGILVR